MRQHPETIRLGPNEWLIRPLTLAQVQAIEPILMATQETKGNVAAAISIVSIALTRDHASSADSLMEIEATASEIAAAMTSVLRLGGFIDTRSGATDLPGEAEADVLKI